MTFVAVKNMNIHGNLKKSKTIKIRFNSIKIEQDIIVFAL